MSILPLLAAALLVGLLVGRLVDLVVEQVPRGRPLQLDRFACRFCGRRLQPLELVPLLGYLSLGGRCGGCGAAIGWRTPAVEAAVGMLAVASLAVKGLSPEALRLFAYGSILLAILFIDLEHRIVPNRLLYPAVLVRLADMALFQPSEALGYLAGGVVGFLLFLLPILLYPAGMGMGDAKLAGFIGLLLGMPETLAAVWAAFVLGGVVAALLLVSGRKGRKDAIPFAPYLVFAALLVSLAAPQSLLSWLS